MIGRADEHGPVQDEPSDAALVQCARAGDPVARAALFERHWQLLFSLCVRTLGDADLAHDAAQEASVQALLSLDRLRRAESFGPWLAGIGLNVCRGWLRYRHQDAWSWDAMLGGRVVDEPLDWRADPAELAEIADLSAHVCRAVAGLPSGQRAAALLFYLSGHTYAEVAAQLGIQVSAVKTRLHKARATLRQELVAVWEESMVAYEALPATDDQPIEMQVVDVRRVRANTEGGARHVIVLSEVGGERSFLFWVGGFEGTSIAMLLEKTETARPLTFAFMNSVLEASGGTLRQVRITRLDQDTMYAVAVVEGPAGSHEIDCRPSDAVALAMLRGAPILVEQAAITALDRLTQERSGETITQRLARLRENSVGPLLMVTEVLRAPISRPWRQKADADSPPAISSASTWNPDELLPLFNERARRMLDLAKEEAVSLNHHYIGTEHLLLGMLRDDDAAATRFLAQHGVTRSNVRETLVHEIGRGDRSVTDQIELTPRAGAALVRAVDEMRVLQHACVGADHLLLGLVREDLGLAARLLVRLGVDLDLIRQRTLTIQSQEN